MIKNPLVNISPLKRTIGLYIVQVSVMLALPLLSANKLYWYMLIPSGFWFLYNILYLYADSIPESTDLSKAILKSLYILLGAPKENDIRCTILIPKDGDQCLVQSARYEYDGRGISESTIPFGKGVAGQCFEENKTILEVIDKEVDFIDYMMGRSFTQEEAKQFLSDRKEYLCVPITEQGNRPLGVLSLDSKKYETFDENIGKTIEGVFVPIFLHLLSERRD